MSKEICFTFKRRNKIEDLTFEFNTNNIDNNEAEFKHKICLLLNINIYFINRFIQNSIQSTIQVHQEGKRERIQINKIRNERAEITNTRENFKS